MEFIVSVTSSNSLWLSNMTLYNETTEKKKCLEMSQKKKPMQCHKMMQQSNFMGFHNQYNQSVDLHPPKQTWNLKMDPWKRRFLLETIISRFHVNFWGCMIIWEWFGNNLELQRSQEQHPCDLRLGIRRGWWPLPSQSTLIFASSLTTGGWLRW